MLRQKMSSVIQPNTLPSRGPALWQIVHSLVTGAFEILKVRHVGRQGSQQSGEKAVPAPYWWLDLVRLTEWLSLALGQ